MTEFVQIVKSFEEYIMAMANVVDRALTKEMKKVRAISQAG
jgi:hypothetical protein